MVQFDKHSNEEGLISVFKYPSSHGNIRPLQLHAKVVVHTLVWLPGILAPLLQVGPVRYNVSSFGFIHKKQTVPYDAQKICKNGLDALMLPVPVNKINDHADEAAVVIEEKGGFVLLGHGFLEVDDSTLEYFFLAIHADEKVSSVKVIVNNLAPNEQHHALNQLQKKSAPHPGLRKRNGVGGRGPLHVLRYKNVLPSRAAWATARHSLHVIVHPSADDARNKVRPPHGFSRVVVCFAEHEALSGRR